MDDVTIEDEFDSNEQILSKNQIKTSTNIFQIFNEQWFLLLLLIGFLTLIYLFQKRRKPSNSNSPTVVSTNNEDRYEQMIRIREQQQKAYEEQALRHAEDKKARMEALKMNSTEEKAKPMKYRSNDHNPLTGQSTSGSSNSCSWKPSSKRKGAGG